MITRERVIDTLRANPEDASTYILYMEQRQAEIDPSDSRANFALMVESADIWRDAGALASAREIYEEYVQDIGDVEPDLYEYCLQEIEKLPRLS